MTNVELVRELRRWAQARAACNKRRNEQGKEPLDSDLLSEAADRLEKITTEPITKERVEEIVAAAFASVDSIDLHSRYDHVRKEALAAIRGRLVSLIMREV